MHVLPPHIQAYDPGSFARFTVDERMPTIVSDVTAQLDRAARLDPRWHDLTDAIVNGAPIDAELFDYESPYWQSWLRQRAGMRWAELCFFELEFLFYLGLRSIARDVAPGFELFRRARDAALADALPQVTRYMERCGLPTLEQALLLSLGGNTADLSQLQQADAGFGLLVDERRELLQRLRFLDGDGRVQLLADNAGPELSYDLVLVDALLRRDIPVEVQLKAAPMFVSDALVADAERTILSFREMGSGSTLSAIGERLRWAAHRGDLKLTAHAEWGEPRHMNDLGVELSNALAAAPAVLAKGDLNYRRFFADRAWPADTPVSLASVASGMWALALRVLKSDCVVGLEASQVAQLRRMDPGWRGAGRWSIVQRVDDGQLPADAAEA